MKIKVEQSILNNAISTVAKGIENNNTNAILDNILFVAKNSKLELSSINNEFSIKKTIDAKIEEEGEILIEGKILNQIINKYPSGEKVSLETEENKIKIKCKRSKTELSIKSSKNFPKDNLEKLEGKEIEIPGNKLKKLLAEALYAISAEESRPILTCGLLEIENDDLKLVTLDGYRLVYRKEKLISNNFKELFKAIIPGKTLLEVSKLLPTKTENVKIKITESLIIFSFADTILSSKLYLNEKFIEYSQILPKENPYEVFVNRNELLEALQRANVMSSLKTDKNAIMFNIAKENLQISCNSQLGNIQENVKCESNINEELKIAFNNNYLLDAIKNIPEEKLSLQFNNNVSPCIITSSIEETKDNYYALVLPVRILNM